MSGHLRSPNENLPTMDLDGTNKGRKPLAKPEDPRKKSQNYANNRNFIIQSAVPAQQYRNPDLMNVSDDEEDGARSTQSTQEQQQLRPPPPPPQISFNATETTFGTNALRRRPGRTDYPLLAMDDLVYGIHVQPMVQSSSVLIPTPSSNSLQNQVLNFPSPFDLLLQPPPPPPPAFLSEGQILPQAAAQSSVQPPPLLETTESTAAAGSVFQRSSFQNSTDVLPSPSSFIPSSSRASIDLSSSNNAPPFMSPPEPQQQSPNTTNISNPTYFDSTLKTEGNPIEAARYHLETKVYDKYYVDLKSTNSTDNTLHSNIVKGLKYLLSDSKILNKALKDCENELDKKNKQIEKDNATMNGLKEMNQQEKDKAKKAIDEKDEAKAKLKKVEHEAQQSATLLKLQMEISSKTKEQNARLIAENDRLKASATESNKAHDDEIKKLKEELKAEQDGKAALKEKLAKAEEESEKYSKEAKKYRARKKEAEAEVTRAKKELEEVKEERDKKESQITKLEKDQKDLIRENKEFTQKMNDAEDKLKELKDKLNVAKKEKEDAKKEGKEEGRLEVEAELKPLIEQNNQRSEALKLLFRDANTADILSRKRRIRPQPAPISHSVSDAGPSAAKRARVDQDSSSVRPHSNPQPAIIRSEPITYQQPCRTTSASNNNGTTLFANDGLGNLMQQIRANPQQNNNVPVTPPINVQVVNPMAGIRPTFLPHGIQQQQPRMMMHPPAQQRLYPTPPPPYLPMANAPALPQINEPNFPERFQIFEDWIGYFLRQNHYVTEDTALSFFQSLDTFSQNALKQYTILLSLMKQRSANPIIKMLQKSQADVAVAAAAALRPQVQVQPFPERQQTGRRHRNARVGPEPPQNQINLNQPPPPILQQQQQRFIAPSSSLRHTPQIPQRQQQTPPIQQQPSRPPLSTNANVSNASPILTQALNTRSSNHTVNNDGETDIQNLIDLCLPSRREINGYVRRQFNIPLGDTSYRRDGTSIHQAFRDVLPYVTRRR